MHTTPSLPSRAAHVPWSASWSTLLHPGTAENSTRPLLTSAALPFLASNLMHMCTASLRTLSNPSHDIASFRDASHASPQPSEAHAPW